MPSTNERLTIEQLEQDPLFLQLTQKQRTMVQTFIASDGDRVMAVLSAYDVKSEEVARIISYEFFQNPKIIAVLAAYFQTDPREVFKDEVRRAMHNKKLTAAQVKVMKLYADMNGWTKGT